MDMINSIYLISNNLEQSETEEVIEESTGTSTEPRVILFNDEEHDFDEVIEQLIKAIHCSYDHAESLTWEVHNKGKATVFEGDMDECVKVSSILEEIALHTQILI